MGENQLITTWYIQTAVNQLVTTWYIQTAVNQLITTWFYKINRQKSTTVISTWFKQIPRRESADYHVELLDPTVPTPSPSPSTHFFLHTCTQWTQWPLDPCSPWTSSSGSRTAWRIRSLDLDLDLKTRKTINQLQCEFISTFFLGRHFILVEIIYANQFWGAIFKPMNDLWTKQSEWWLNECVFSVFNLFLLDIFYPPHL